MSKIPYKETEETMLSIKKGILKVLNDNTPFQGGFFGILIAQDGIETVIKTFGSLTPAEQVKILGTITESIKNGHS